MYSMNDNVEFTYNGKFRSGRIDKIYKGKSIVLEHDNPNEYPCSKTGSPKKYSTYNLSKIGVLKVKIKV